MNDEYTKDPERVSVTLPARRLIEQLISTHGPIMFHQSGGCCDGSAPMCFQVGEFKLGERGRKGGRDCRLRVLDGSRAIQTLGAHPLDRGCRARAGRELLARGAPQLAIHHSLRDVFGAVARGVGVTSQPFASVAYSGGQQLRIN